MAQTNDEGVESFTFRRAIMPTEAAFREYDPSRPNVSLEAREVLGHAAEGPGIEVAIDPQTGLPSLDARGIDDIEDQLLEPPGMEIYEHGGRTLFPEWDHTHGEPGRMLARARRRARAAEAVLVSCRVEAGRRFELEGHPEATFNREYLVTRAEHRGAQGLGGADSPNGHSARVECVPADVTFVPKLPERRVVQAVLTATVVGPESEEVHVNARGEIKVRFHWDRARSSADSAVWIRCMQCWAGAGWGTQFIPRVGMEVVVAFENGDVDKPLILGTLANGINPTPFRLPNEKSKSGFRTRSTPSNDGYSELSFDDDASRERIYLRAQRDFDSVVLRNRTATVDKDDRTLVRGDRSAVVEGTEKTEVTRERSTLVGGDDAVDVRGSRLCSVRADDRAHIARDRSVRVDGTDRREVMGEDRSTIHGDTFAELRGAAAISVGRADKKRSATAVIEGPTVLRGSEVIDILSDKEIVLRVGASSIRIGPEQIEIASSRVDVYGKDARLALAEGNAKLKLKKVFQVIADESLVLVGPQASFSLKEDATVHGARVLLNSPSLATDVVRRSDFVGTKVELVDQLGNPIPYQRFVITLKSGQTYSGFLDGKGQAEVDVEGSGIVTFPDLNDAQEA